MRAAQPVEAVRTAFGGPLPRTSTPPGEVIEALIAAAEGGLVATAGPRFFGFVIGGALPSATAGEVLAAGWDQCALNGVLSPAATAAEETAGQWLIELLRLPAGERRVRHRLPGRQHRGAGQWPARRPGPRRLGRRAPRADRAPRIRVMAGVERHATINRSLRLLGLGNAAVEDVAADTDGAIDIIDLRRVLAAGPPGPVTVCLQAGNVKTGACDDLRAAVALAREHGALHRPRATPRDAQHQGLRRLRGARGPRTRPMRTLGVECLVE